jgi:hypothetical protein
MYSILQSSDIEYLSDKTPNPTEFYENIYLFVESLPEKLT